jgi:hypothetical protein
LGFISAKNMEHIDVEGQRIDDENAEYDAEVEPGEAEECRVLEGDSGCR